MIINDDADAPTIKKETISAAAECARMIGKIGPTFTATDLDDMEKAVQQVLNAINVKKGTITGGG